MKASTIITATAAALPAVTATPHFNFFKQWNRCDNIDWLISANHAKSSAQTFCSAYNKIQPVTVIEKAVTTVAGVSVVVTKVAATAVAALTTVTSTSTVTTTTASSAWATQTCTPDGRAPTGLPNVLEKRHNRNPDCWTNKWDWPYPTAQYKPTQIADACSCIATTPTSTVTKVATVTKAGSTTTVTSTKASTTTTNTITENVIVTATSTLLQLTTETIPIGATHTFYAGDGTAFYQYDGMEQIDFQAGDLKGSSGCGCDADGSGNDCVVLDQNYGKCFGFESCQNICAQINQQTGNLTCVGVTMDGPDSSGSCYFKGDLHACGTYNPGRRSGLIELNGYPFAA